MQYCTGNLNEIILKNRTVGFQSDDNDLRLFIFVIERKYLFSIDAYFNKYLSTILAHCFIKTIYSKSLFTESICTPISPLSLKREAYESILGQDNHSRKTHQTAKKNIEYEWKTQKSYHQKHHKSGIHACVSVR